MKITLKAPYTVGDLNQTASYPHVYITTFYVNGPALVATIGYEVGTLGDPTVDAPMGQWAKALEVPAMALQITGTDLFPFFATPVQVPSGDPTISSALWDQVEKLLYEQIQVNNDRMVGEIS